MTRLAFAALLLAAPGLAPAQVYKCVDQNGRVQYTQTKPAGKSCEGVEAKAPASLGSSENLDALKEYGKKIDADRGEQAKVQADAEQAEAKKERRCEQWRARLAALEQAGRVFTVDAKGERHYRTDAQNEAMREQARQGVAAECGG